MAAPKRQSVPSVSPTSWRRRSTASAEELTAYYQQPLTDWDIIDQAQQGVTAQQVNQLTQVLNVSLKEMAAMLQLSESAFHRFRSKDHFNQQASERALYLQNLVVHGLSVFGNRMAVFANWLRHPLGELNSHSPLELLTSITGCGLVDDVLTRIDYGIYV